MNKKYNTMLRKLARTRSQTRRLKLRKVLAKYRAKMIKTRRKTRNRAHPADAGKIKKWNKAALKRQMKTQYRRKLDGIEKTAAGKAALRKYKKFWGLPFPTAIRDVSLPGPKNQKMYLVGMGVSPKVLLANGPKGKATELLEVSGKRAAATTSDGRRILIVGNGSKIAKGRRPKGKNFFGGDSKMDALKKVRKFSDYEVKQPKSLKTKEGTIWEFVGWAPETHYIPTAAMEKLGTFKANKYWIHKHHDDGGNWPAVYRDRKTDSFLYGPSTYRVTDWIRR